MTSSAFRSRRTAPVSSPAADSGAAVGPSPSPGGAVTMADVARLAGVGAITVSRVVNTPDKVAPATRARVQAAIAQIGYVPNLIAGSLASRRSRIVAAVVPTIANSIFADTVEGLSESLAAAGYELLLGQSNYQQDVEDKLVAAFLGRRVDGLVLTGVAHSRATRERLMRAGVPVVETWDITPTPIDMVVGFSNRDAGQAMATHLLQAGRRRIAYVGGGDDRSLARRAGWLAALQQAGLAPAAEVRTPSPTSLREGRQALSAVLASAPDADAIFFSNDVLAIGALLECRRLGYPVPGRLAIAGFADLDLAAEFSPTLTSVHVRGRAIGTRAAQLLLQRFGGEPVASPVVDVGYAVMARESG